MIRLSKNERKLALILTSEEPHSKEELVMKLDTTPGSLKVIISNLRKKLKLHNIDLPYAKRKSAIYSVSDTNALKNVLSND